MGRAQWRVACAAVLGVLAGAAGGCDDEESVEDRACESAAATIEACFGEGSADAFLDSCSPNDAARIEGRQCLDLTTVVLDDKADATWDGEVLEAIREALHQAIEQGLTAALEQVLDRLTGVSAEDYAAYLLLETTDTEAEAYEAAERWAEDLEGRPGFEPTVVAYATGYGVAHAPCLIDLTSVLPSMIADLVLETPDTIGVLGGEIHEAKQTETSRDIDVSLPLILLPTHKDEAEHPSCVN